MALAPAAAPLSMTPVGRMVFFAGNRSFPWQLPAADARQLLTGFAAAPGYDAANWVGMFDLPTHLHTVTQPVLFLQGTNDPITGQVLRYLPLLPHARAPAAARSQPRPDLGRSRRHSPGHMREFLQKVSA